MSAPQAVTLPGWMPACDVATDDVIASGRFDLIGVFGGNPGPVGLLSFLLLLARWGDQDSITYEDPTP